MSHHLEYVSSAALSALVIRGDATTHSPSRNYARITKLGGGFNGSKGIRIKTRVAEDESGAGPVDIRGEDLYALREFLAELPEEAFVRPADPVEKPDRWTDGDIIEEFYGTANAERRIWVRGPIGWSYVGRSLSWEPNPDVMLEGGLATPATSAGPGYTRVVRQASGQDL